MGNGATRNRQQRYAGRDNNNKGPNRRARRHEPACWLTRQRRIQTTLAGNFHRQSISPCAGTLIFPGQKIQTAKPPVAASLSLDRNGTRDSATRRVVRWMNAVVVCKGALNLRRNRRLGSGAANFRSLPADHRSVDL